MSRLIRRTHMYLALFLGPWMLAYAISTIIMAHGWTAPQTFSVERELQYDAPSEFGATPQQQARLILQALDLEGAFGVQGPNPQGRLVINRQGLVTPRRITYTPVDGRVVVEKGAVQMTTILNRFHHRRTYTQPYAADRSLAASIDLVVVAMIFWALSGIWMWWEMRATRAFGALCFVAGLGLFGFFFWTL